MALFVQIDHFRKTDQKPTVKNHLFSISWFRSFNRTSFQQQLKLSNGEVFKRVFALQSYILSTTTETRSVSTRFCCQSSFNRTSFQQQLKLRPQRQAVSRRLSFNRTSFQQQLKQYGACHVGKRLPASIVHPFNNN